MRLWSLPVYVVELQWTFSVVVWCGAPVSTLRKRGERGGDITLLGPKCSLSYGLIFCTFFCIFNSSDAQAGEKGVEIRLEEQCKMKTSRI